MFLKKWIIYWWIYGTAIFSLLLLIVGEKKSVFPSLKKNKDFSTTATDLRQKISFYAQ